MFFFVKFFFFWYFYCSGSTYIPSQGEGFISLPRVLGFISLLLCVSTVTTVDTVQLKSPLSLHSYKV